MNFFISKDYEWKLINTIVFDSNKICQSNNGISNNEVCLNIKEPSLVKEIVSYLKDRKDSTFVSKELISILFTIDSLNKNIIDYNNIAYYLEQSKAYTEAIFILEKIIKKFPNRIVAYINLGDAYWGNENHELAIKNYTIYIEKMKNKGLEHKIPQRIYDRVNTK